MGKKKRKRAAGTVILFSADGETVGFTQSSRTTTLRMVFDESKIVKSFKSMTSNF